MAQVCYETWTWRLRPEQLKSRDMPEQPDRGSQWSIVGVITNISFTQRNYANRSTNRRHSFGPERRIREGCCICTRSWTSSGASTSSGTLSRRFVEFDRVVLSTFAGWVDRSTANWKERNRRSTCHRCHKTLSSCVLVDMEGQDNLLSHFLGLTID